MTDREGREGQQLLSAVAQHGLELGELPSQPSGDDIELVVDMGAGRLGEDGPDGRGYHLGRPLGHPGQDVSEEVGLYGNNVPLFVLLFRSGALEVAWRSQRMLACSCRCGLGCYCRT